MGRSRPAQPGTRQARGQPQLEAMSLTEAALVDRRDLPCSLADRRIPKWPAQSWRSSTRTDVAIALERHWATSRRSSPIDPSTSHSLVQGDRASSGMFRRAPGNSSFGRQGPAMPDGTADSSERDLLRKRVISRWNNEGGAGVGGREQPAPAHAPAEPALPKHVEAGVPQPETHGKKAPLERERLGREVAKKRS